LFSKTSAEARLAEHTDRGWRKALYCALSDGKSLSIPTKVNPKLRKKEEEEFSMSLFDTMKGDL
jgi:hypothetical protein